jgi:hypothetical protein
VIDERLPAGRKAAAAYQHLLDSDGEGGGGASDSEEPLLWLVGVSGGDVRGMCGGDLRWVFVG